MRVRQPQTLRSVLRIAARRREGDKSGEWEALTARFGRIIRSAEVSMPLSERLQRFLNSHHAEVTLTTHPTAFTAREVAAAEHLPAREVAKTVLVFGDGEYHM